MSWKVSLPCTRAEAEAIDTEGATLADLDPPPVLTTTEGVEDDPDSWHLDAYFETEPGDSELAAIRLLVPSAAARTLTPQRIVDQDWVTISQAGLPPIAVGRFHVHTAADPGTPARGARVFRIEAGLAFGTGQHATTAGCLAMLDAMRDEGVAVANLVDLGTGTGLLAFAALHLWPGARASATDIDPVAINVARQNAALNHVAIGSGPGAVRLIVADGGDGPDIDARAPFDLIVANILAQPLIAMAPAVAAIATPGAELVLAGLLATQADAVTAAYREAGFAPVARLARGDWTILRMRKATA